MQPHQERVVVEKRELDEKLGKLTQFINSDAYKAVDAAEQQRLFRQQTLMIELSAVLGARIEAF
jgi:hypothetical protein